jgi:hypothetical protein
MELARVAEQEQRIVKVYLALHFRDDWFPKSWFVAKPDKSPDLLSRWIPLRRLSRLPDLSEPRHSWFKTAQRNSPILRYVLLNGPQGIAASFQSQ